MCKAFSCIVTDKGEALWKFGVDLHATILETFNIPDRADPARNQLRFAKVEISPANGSYLAPDKWVLTIDETLKPDWWEDGCEKAARKALAQWKRKLYSILKRGPIIYPFKKKPPNKITERHIELLKQWASVRASVWASVLASVWALVWASVWASVRDSVWAYTGSFFNLPRSTWKYTEKIPGNEYPFRPVVYLWEDGLVPSFDGKVWRLHGGKDAKILWQGTI